ncbi:hypothetical protein [Hyphococcus sp. DH-69]|uniref:hypothetical protein n=1 Tax=Hyphococcus formosus TaxID=3143534 RepID=UPI00398A91D7
MTRFITIIGVALIAAVVIWMVLDQREPATTTTLPAIDTPANNSDEEVVLDDDAEALLGTEEVDIRVTEPGDENEGIPDVTMPEEGVEADGNLTESEREEAEEVDAEADPMR